jgi:5-methylcytosine-specific restriction endonuclease McrA
VYLDKVEVVVSYREEIRSPSTSIRMPAVVRLKRKVAAEKRGPKFSRFNVYLRDGFACCYCDIKLPMARLTYDHVIPRAQGGRTEWENIVTACSDCNMRKGNRTPDQCGMFPRRRAHRPAFLPLLPPAIDVNRAPAEWREFVTVTPANFM